MDFPCKMNFYRSIDESDELPEEVQMDNVVPVSDQNVENDPLATTSTTTSPTKRKYSGATGPRCFVKNCQNTTKKRDEEGLSISFHKFPRDPALQKIWVRRCCSQKDAKLANRYVCSIHFEPPSFSKQHKPGSKRKIRANAVPTLHLPIGEDETEETPVNFAGSPERAPSAGDMNATYEQDIEMVVLSSDEDAIDVTGPPMSHDTSALTSADVLAATTALLNPRPPQAHNVVGKTVAKSSKSAKKSPGKATRIEPVAIANRDERSMDGSINSDAECEEEDFSFDTAEELDFLDLQDPLEQQYHVAIWKNMNEKSRRATLRAYFSRLASFLPLRFSRNSKTAILDSAMQYLDEVTRDNATLAVEEEILMQRFYKLRKIKSRLDEMTRKAKNDQNNAPSPMEKCA